MNFKNNQRFWKFVTFFGSIGIIFLIFLLWILAWKSHKILIFTIAVLILEDIIGGLIKLTFFKHRPIPQSFSNIIQKIDAGSFPSIHSARSFSLFLISCIFAIWPYCIVFLIFWILIALSRVYLSKHFWIDILGWVLLSTSVVFLIYLIASYSTFLT